MRINSELTNQHWKKLFTSVKSAEQDSDHETSRKLTLAGRFHRSGAIIVIRSLNVYYIKISKLVMVMESVQFLAYLAQNVVHLIISPFHVE